jgi:glycosyltransferase involved in cell wall biosynthesis
MTKVWGFGVLPIFDQGESDTVLVRRNGTGVPAVTVIILASDDSVIATIESVLAQDYSNFHCIVVEDELIIDFARVVAAYHAEQFGQLNFLPGKNGSVCNTLSDAWRRATGHYVTIVRSGENFRNNWLSACVEFLETNPETIVGFPDWIRTDREGNVLQEIRAFDYDFYKMVHDVRRMPGPGALIRRSAVYIPRLRNRSFRLADGYEIWLLLALQGDFIHISATLAARLDDAGALKERLAEYCRARDTLFNQPGLPKTVQSWRHSARAVAPKMPWTGITLLFLAFQIGPRPILRRLFFALTKDSGKLTYFGVSSSFRGWISAIADRITSARQNSRY